MTRDELLSRYAAGERDFGYANLAGVNLTGANLEYAILTYANLSDANLTWANLTWANLSGAILTDANLTRASLAWARMTGANLVGANLTRAILTEAILADAILPVPDLPRKPDDEGDSMTKQEIKEGLPYVDVRCVPTLSGYQWEISGPESRWWIQGNARSLEEAHDELRSELTTMAFELLRIGRTL